MAYQSTVIPIMIASPGDVLEEREIIRSVIHDWNDINAANTKVFLSPVGWDTHSSPELGERPQELINSRLLKKCDLLVGVFWTRLGTPTGKAPSGSVEEIQEHIGSGKPAMIYFSSKPVAPEALDSEQFEAVKKFKAHCRENGLVEEFENINQFKEKFSKQLQVCLIQNKYLNSLIHQANQPEAPRFEDEPEFHPRHDLSGDAITLLKAASSREDGTILKTAVVGGRFIHAGGNSFGGDRVREAAKWENALAELVHYGLVVERGYKGEVFELTHQGWELADSL